MLRAIVVRNSANAKLGNAHATYASQATCPRRCPFLNHGCYAENSPTGIHTARLNNNDHTADQEIAEEAKLIKQLPDDKPLRLHVVGDASTPAQARQLAKACEARKQPTWTYTHAWGQVPRSAWGSISVLASTESVTMADEAMYQFYAAAMVVSHFPNGDKAWNQDGFTFIPCPAQTRNKTCSECRLCFNDRLLSRKRLVIAFEAHGSRANTVRKELAKCQ